MQVWRYKIVSSRWNSILVKDVLSELLMWMEKGGDTKPLIEDYSILYCTSKSRTDKHNY